MAQIEKVGNNETNKILIAIKKDINNIKLSKLEIDVYTYILLEMLFGDSSSFRQQLFDSAASSIKSNPIIGRSIISLANDNGTVTLTKNTILSTMVLGGVFALIAFIVYEIKLYMLCLKKESQDKWLFFLMLLFVEIIGIIDNTIYNLYILIFILTVLSCYQMSNRQLDIIVHSDYYEKFDKYQEKKLD